MDVEVTPIPEQADRLSDMNRFFETVYFTQSSVYSQKRSIYFIAKDTAATNFTLSSTGVYNRDTFKEYGGFTYSAGEVTIPKDGWYYIGYMINLYQIHVPTVEFTLQGKKSSSLLMNERDNYGYCTLGSSDIVLLAKNDKISITYTISAGSIYSPNQVYTVGDSSKLFIFELPNLAIS